MQLRRFFIKFFVGLGAIVLPWTSVPHDLKAVLETQLVKPSVTLITPTIQKPTINANLSKDASLKRTALNDIEMLTSSEMGGRRAGSTGEKEVLQYLTNELTLLGLKPMGDNANSFTTTFTLPSVKQAIIGSRLSFIGSTQSGIELTSKNILGGIQGVNQNEVILISAHYDHLGVYQGNLYAGANDNASGVGCTFDVIRKLVQENKTPTKTIVIALWGGEEMGFVGSQAFINSPTFPLSNIKAVINVDTVGNGSLGDLAIWSDGDNLASQTIQEVALKQWVLAPRIPNDGHNSDHVSFSKVNIPAVTLLSRDWLQNNHSPQDTVGNINKDQIKLATDIVYQTVKKLAFE